MASKGNFTKGIPIAIAALSMAVSIWLRSEGDVAEDLTESAPPTDTEPTPPESKILPPGKPSPKAQPTVVEDDVPPTKTNDCNGLENQKWKRDTF